MNAAERILLTLWVGALWAVGYLAVPVLFHELPQDRMLAGALAGKMFTLVAYLGIGCGLVLATGELARGLWRPTWRLLVIATMVALTAANHFWLQSLMQALKEAGPLVDGTPRMAEFARLHGISEVIYMATSLAGLALVAFGNKDRR